MTPFEKAEELVIKMYDTFTITWDYDNWVIAKQCALIAVEQILENGFDFTDESEYWHTVKTEIEKI